MTIMVFFQNRALSDVCTARIIKNRFGLLNSLLFLAYSKVKLLVKFISLFFEMNDLVSIVTSAHNSSAFISETVESILNQDYPFFELLIVDDCSSDDTWQIISGFSRRDKRIKCFKYDYSIGPAIARNAAIFIQRSLHCLL